MNNIEKLERILTRELVQENIEIVRHVQKLEINSEKIRGMYGNTYLSGIYIIKYLITLNEEGYHPFRNMKVELSIDLTDMNNSKDSDEEKELLAILIQNHIEELEKKIKSQIDIEDYQIKYELEVTKKVQQYFNSKNKFKGEFGFKDGNLYVTSSGFKYMNTPYKPHKPEVLVTPDYLETIVEDDEHKTSIEFKGKRINCKLEKKPAKQINKSLDNFKEGYDKLVDEFFPENKNVVKNTNVARVMKLGSLTLQEKDGKLAVTDKNGSTRFI